jgi:hypothetical protein
MPSPLTTQPAADRLPLVLPCAAVHPVAHKQLNTSAKKLSLSDHGFGGPQLCLVNSAPRGNKSQQLGRKFLVCNLQTMLQQVAPVAIKRLILNLPHCRNIGHTADIALEKILELNSVLKL